jgi:hypothetical protein
MLALFRSVCSSIDTDGLLNVKFLDYTVKREYNLSTVSKLTAEIVVLSTSTRGVRCDNCYSDLLIHETVLLVLLFYCIQYTTELRGRIQKVLVQILVRRPVITRVSTD